MSLHLPVSLEGLPQSGLKREMFSFIGLFCWVLFSRTLCSAPNEVENEEQVSNQL